LSRPSGNKAEALTASEGIRITIEILLKQEDGLLFTIFLDFSLVLSRSTFGAVATVQHDAASYSSLARVGLQAEFQKKSGPGKHARSLCPSSSQAGSLAGSKPLSHLSHSYLAVSTPATDIPGL
jgi:hypothetical protein